MKTFIEIVSSFVKIALIVSVLHSIYDIRSKVENIDGLLTDIHSVVVICE